MFFYGQDGTTNVVIDLDELETAMLLLGSPGSALHPEAKRWEEFAALLAEVMATSGRFHVIAASTGAGPWRGTLDAAAGPVRTRIEEALGFIAERYGRSFRLENVEAIVT